MSLTTHGAPVPLYLYLRCKLGIDVWGSGPAPLRFFGEPLALLSGHQIAGALTYLRDGLRAWTATPQQLPAFRPKGRDYVKLRRFALYGLYGLLTIPAGDSSSRVNVDAASF